MTIILVWEEVPEYTSVYKLENVSRETHSDLLLCHGYYMNQSDLAPDVDAALSRINIWLVDQKESLIYRSIYPLPPVEIHSPCLIICSGFIL